MILEAKIISVIPYGIRDDDAYTVTLDCSLQSLNDILENQPRAKFYLLQKEKEFEIEPFKVNGTKKAIIDFFDCAQDKNKNWVNVVPETGNIIKVKA